MNYFSKITNEHCFIYIIKNYIYTLFYNWLATHYTKFSVVDLYRASWNVVWVAAEVIPGKTKIIKINLQFSAALMHPVTCNHLLYISKQVRLSDVFTDTLIQNDFFSTCNSEADSEPTVCNPRPVAHHFHLIEQPSLRKKCPYLELFWSAFSHIWTEYGEIQSISPYSVWMWENANQSNSEYRHFVCSASQSRIFHKMSCETFWMLVSAHVYRTHFEFTQNLLATKMWKNVSFSFLRF